MRHTLFSAIALVLVGSSAAHATDPVGISACDDYISKYQACLPNMPEAIRPNMQTALDSQATSWKTLAASGKSDQAAKYCAEATASSKQSLSAFKCDF